MNIRGVHIVEKDIEDWLWENPKAVIVGGYTKVPILKWMARQYSVNSGRLDLLGAAILHGRVYPVVVEIKNVPVNTNAIAQVCRYAQDIDEILEIIESKHYEDHIERFGLEHMPGSKYGHYTLKVIVAPEIENDNILRTANSMHVSIVTFEVNLNVVMNGPLTWNSRYYEECRRETMRNADENIWKEFNLLVDNTYLLDEANEIISKSDGCADV